MPSWLATSPSSWRNRTKRFRIFGRSTWRTCRSFPKQRSSWTGSPPSFPTCSSSILTTSGTTFPTHASSRLFENRLARHWWSWPGRRSTPTEKWRSKSLKTGKLRTPVGMIRKSFSANCAQNVLEIISEKYFDRNFRIIAKRSPIIFFEVSSEF